MRHFYATLDGWFAFREAFDMILAALPDDRPSVIVELGTWVGKSTAYLGVEIANSGKPVTLVAIDHFKGSAEIDGTRWAGDVPGSEAAFRRNLDPVARVLGERFVVVVDDTTLAAADFADGSVDAVWVDASHAYEFVEADIEAWLPKIRPGGIIGGDDYLKCAGVRRAVDEAFGPRAVVPGKPYWMTVVG